MKQPEDFVNTEKEQEVSPNTTCWYFSLIDNYSISQISDITERIILEFED
jgi:hypothetical protein